MTIRIIDDNRQFDALRGFTPYPRQGLGGSVHCCAAGHGEESATWTLGDLEPGVYRIAVTWSEHENRASNARYILMAGSNMADVVPVNQQEAPADFLDCGVPWKNLGEYTVRDATLMVMLTNNADGYVIADAVRVERIGELPNPPPPPPPPPPGPDLILPEHLLYRGWFKLPDALNFGGHAPAHNPARSTLFVPGFYGNVVGEVSIPSLDGSMATLLQAGEITDGIRDVFRDTEVPNSVGIVLGGLLVDAGRIIGTLFDFYDAGYEARSSHFISDSLDLSVATDARGMFTILGANPGVYAGWIAKVPEPWVSRLGCKYVTGQANLSIIGRTSCGPSLHGFDPDDWSKPAVPLVWYPPFGTVPLGSWDGFVELGNPLRSINSTCRPYGVAMIGDCTVFFGIQAPGAFFYGTGDHGWTGQYQPDGIYLPAVWAYRNEDFERAAKGDIEPWQVIPYKVWNFIIPDAPQPPFPGGLQFTGSHTVLGAAYDAANRRLYLTGWGHAGPQVYVYDVVD